MSTFFMFGKYSQEALKGISAERTKKAAALIKKYGGKISFTSSSQEDYPERPSGTTFTVSLPVAPAAGEAGGEAL